MADPPRHPETGDDSNGDPGVGPDRRSNTGTPRWVKVFGIIAIVLVLLFVVIQFTGVGGGHGPGRHTSSGEVSSLASSSGVTLSRATEVRTSLGSSNG